jgi:ATP-dependent Clp protease ATP-binding subunit ClpC
VSEPKRALRVYLVEHRTGYVTGILMRRDESIFDPPPPTAFGATEAQVLEELEEQLDALIVDSPTAMRRFLWDEKLNVRRAKVPLYPQAVVKKRRVIGARRIPVRFTYLWSELKTGGYRVMLPRFGWWFLLEDLAAAEDVLRHGVTSALLGEQPKWLYDFRSDGPERVIEWSPRVVAGREERWSRVESSPFPTLDAVCEEWVERSKRGKLESVAGGLGAARDAAGLKRTLAKDPPPSILVVGPPGAGKTSLVRAVAHLLAGLDDDHVPRLWATTHDRVLAGQIYLGMWQQRCLDMVRELEGEGDYLYVGRLAPFVSDQGDGTSLAQLFAPALHAGEISLIAECTDEELLAIERASPALVGAFHVVKLPELEPDVVVDLLERLPRGFDIHPLGARRAAQHLAGFTRAQAFPGKAFRFVDWLAREDDVKGRTLFAPDVSKLYARYSGLPLELISDEHAGGSEAIADQLRARVIGQDDACGAAARVLSRFKAGLNDPERPVGSLFFVGPTGVGKTELAKALARYLFGDGAEGRSRLVRVDMSELMVPGSAQRLLAAGEGARSLASQVRREPLSLVLLDEVEKAHPEVFDLLLGLLGEGRLTDSLGQLVDFRMTLIVMTSNLGAADKAPIGVGARARDPRDALRRHFRPELLGRIDQVLPFRALDEDDVLKITALELDKALARAGFVSRDLKVEVDAAARAHLARHGYHPQRGARPLKRVIEERLITPLAVRIAKDPAFLGKTVRVGEAEDELTFAGL